MLIKNVRKKIQPQDQQTRIVLWKNYKQNINKELMFKTEQ
jgi:hypothetical protein